MNRYKNAITLFLLPPRCTGRYNKGSERRISTNRTASIHCKRPYNRERNCIQMHYTIIIKHKTTTAWTCIERWSAFNQIICVYIYICKKYQTAKLISLLRSTISSEQCTERGIMKGYIWIQSLFHMFILTFLSLIITK